MSGEVFTVGELLDVALLIEGISPVHLTLLPCVLVFWNMVLFAPIWDRASKIKGIFGSVGYHGVLGNGDIGIHIKVLTLLLFVVVYGQWKTLIDGLVVHYYFFINVSPAIISVLVQDVVENYTDVDDVEAFIRVVELRIISRLDGLIHLFYANALAVLAILPVLKCFGMYALTVGCAYSIMYVDLSWWLLISRIVWSAVLCRKCRRVL